MTSELDRRSFLRAAGALGLGAVAWACAKKTPKASPTAGSNALSVEITGEPQLAVGDTRIAFAMFRGPDPIAPKDVTARISPIGGKPIDVPVTAQNVQRGSGGSQTAGTQVFEVFVLHHAFTAGTWVVDAATGGKHAQAAFQVVDKVPEPKIGDHAIASQSPTVDDHRGVDPICTRTPPCSMHQITIADALTKGMPTVVLFATPEFCFSRTCGPTTDIVESVSKQLSGQASFIHVEVFRNPAAGQKALDAESKGTGLSDTSGDAPTYAEWKLGTEPFLYFIGSDGIIKDRWNGAVGADEVRQRVNELLKA
jgi:hypothetical protein